MTAITHILFACTVENGVATLTLNRPSVSMGLVH